MGKDIKQIDKILDKIHLDFIKTDMEESTLKNLCKQNNIDFEDYLFQQGYTDFDAYIKEYKQKEGTFKMKNEILNYLNDNYDDFEILNFALTVLKMATNRLDGDLNDERIKKEYDELNDIIYQIDKITKNYVQRKEF